MKPRINIIMLGVKDRLKATEFYTKGLGLPQWKFDGDITFFDLNGTWLSLYHWDDLATDVGVDSKGAGFRGVTLAHLVENEQAVDDTLDLALSAEAKIVKSAKKAAAIINSNF